ncbi:hypothetical protein HW555_013356, partial [Spodoptera exigua]
MMTICRTCLKMPREVFPMTITELNTYQSLTRKVVGSDEKLNICILCKWILRKCFKFTQQCLEVDEILKNVIEQPSPQEIEIKLEPILKEEFVEEMPIKERSKRKRKKEIREGFSSRMVQETDEYIVIKLSKEEVLSELAEKAKSDSYIRSPYKCEHCVKGFNFEDEHGDYKCDICSQYCPSLVSLRGHIKSHTTRYKCKICGHVRLSRQNLLEHHAIAHTMAPASYTCDKCQFTS